MNCKTDNHAMFLRKLFSICQVYTFRYVDSRQIRSKGQTYFNSLHTILSPQPYCSQTNSQGSDIINKLLKRLHTTTIKQCSFVEKMGGGGI